MRLKLDENLPVDLLSDLQATGHDTDTVPAEGLAGSADPDVIAAAQAAGRVLITLDVGAVDARQIVGATAPGIVLLRLGTQGIQAARQAVLAALPVLEATDMIGRIAVVSEATVRFRPPP